MGKVFSALSATTANNMQLDAGVIAFGPINIESFSGDIGTIKNQLIGATKGGAQFSAVPEVRDLLDGIDGVRGAYKATQTIDSWEVTLKTTITELTKVNLERIMTGKGAGSTVGSHKKVTANVGLIPASDFKDLYWLGATVGGSKPMIIELKNALNVNGINFTAEDKATGTIEVEFKAHFDLANPDTVPFAIYVPNELEGAVLVHHAEELELKK